MKEDAPALLREELAAPSWTPRTVALSGVTDPYQPAERRLALTRGCLKVFAECRNPVIVITKNRLREMREGRLNDPRFGSRMRGQGVYAEEIRSLFSLAKRRSGIPDAFPALSIDSFRRPQGPQLTLFP